MRRILILSLAATILSWVVSACGSSSNDPEAEAAASRAGGAVQPLGVHSHRDRVMTSKGNVCPDGAACPGSRYRPQLRPRLAVNIGKAIHIQTNLSARSVRVQVERPSADGTGPRFVKSGPAMTKRSGRGEHWTFLAPRRRSRDVSTMTITVDYGTESASYEAGLRIRPQRRQR